MLKIQKQISRLLAVSALSSFQLAGASWVALLAARGFSLVEIGLAESCFHLASLLFEIPSGVISDVFGRRRCMILSQLTSAVSALCMAFSRNLAGVCLALMLDAFSYNFASGAREALAYDSLKIAGRQQEYMHFSARELAIYRTGNAAAILCAGLALAVGHRIAYLLDALLALLGLVVAWGLDEARVEDAQLSGGALERTGAVLRQSLGFLRHGGRSLLLMLANALAGSMAILTAFFLQARLRETDLPPALLGAALFAVSMGGAAGARISGRILSWRFSRCAGMCMAGVALGVACALGNRPLLMCIGGFTANLCGDLLEVRADAALNDRFPSSQRSTLLSVASLVFSLVMILLSPLAGMIFG